VQVNDAQENTLSPWWWLILGVLSLLTVWQISVFSYVPSKGLTIGKTLLYIGIAVLFVSSELSLALWLRPSLRKRKGVVKTLIFFLVLNPFLLLLLFTIIFWNSSFPFTDV